MPPNIKGAGKRMNTLRQLCKVCLFSLEIASIMDSKVNSTSKIYIGTKMTTAPTPLIYSRSNVGGETYINSTPPQPPCTLSLPRPRLLPVALSLHFPVPFPNILLPPLPLPPSPSFCVMILETARHRRRSDDDTPVHSSDIHFVPTPVPHDTSESLSLRCAVAAALQRLYVGAALVATAPSACLALVP